MLPHCANALARFAMTISKDRQCAAKQKTHTNTADRTQRYWHNSTQCVPHKSTTLLASQKARLRAYYNSHNEALCLSMRFHILQTARDLIAHNPPRKTDCTQPNQTHCRSRSSRTDATQQLSMRSSQSGRHKPHSASRSKCLTPPRTEVALHTQQRQAIQFHSTKLNRFPQRTNAPLCHATRRNAAHAQTENCPHNATHDAPYSASSQ